MKPTKQQPEKNLAPRRKTALALGRVLPAVVPTATGEASTLAQIASNWGVLCPGLAAWSYPSKLFKGTLTVVVASSSVKQEIMYLAGQIMQGSALLLGYAAVEKVIATPVGWQRTHPQLTRPQALRQEEVAKMLAKCNHVTDEELRSALARLGAWAARENKK
jgi:hypothetical protein